MKGTEQNGKLYPFSGTKHAHDIDFRRSRVKNELAEAIQLKGNRLVCVISDEEYEALEKLEEQLDDLIGYVKVLRGNAMAKKYRYGTTRQGYQITNCLTDEYGRTTIVAKRANDYMVAKGYNYRGDGSWAQGYYMFPTRKSAVNFAKYHSYRRKR